jgi:hypothetical protein
MKPDAPIWTGHLSRNSDGTYTGEIRDVWGWPISLSAVVEDYEGGKRFRLTGDVRADRIPAAMRIEEIDGPIVLNPDSDARE